MNYRKYYEEMCNLKIPSNCEIHHIDFNRQNNNINNLVMLPATLHTKYHTKLSEYKGFNLELDEQLKSPLIGYNYNEFALNEWTMRAKKFVETWYECESYVCYRDYKLGLSHLIDVEQIEEVLYGKNKSTQN